MQNLTPTPNPNSNNDIEQCIAHERIRQARNAFNLALAATAFSALFSLVGAITLITGKVPVGSITTALGLTSSICCRRLATDTNDRLDKLMATLDHE